LCQAKQKKKKTKEKSMEKTKFKIGQSVEIKIPHYGNGFLVSSFDIVTIDSFGATPHYGVTFNTGKGLQSGWMPVAFMDSFATISRYPFNV
jgi:hypothetical protein